MKKITIFVIFLGISLISGVSFAGVIYDNGGPDPDGNAYFNDSGTYDNLNADSFTLQAGANTITDIHWWGVYTDNVAKDDNFTIVIYDTSGAAFLPGNSVSPINSFNESRSDTGLDLFGALDIYSYSVFIDPITLNFGETYWLEVLNNTTPNEQGWAWAWVTSQLDGDHAYWQSNNGEYWAPTFDNLAFNLTNDAAPVPEPSTFLLLGGGLAGLGFVVRRRKKE